MTMRSQYLPLTMALVTGLSLGVAVSVLAGVPAGAATDEAKAVVTQSIHLTDEDGKVGAVIGLGKDGTPEIRILGEGGRVERSEKLLGPKPMRIGRRWIIPAPSSRPADDCLVLNPRIGFAGGTGD